jgi:hypothetical protein
MCGDDSIVLYRASQFRRVVRSARNDRVTIVGAVKTGVENVPTVDDGVCLIADFKCDDTWTFVCGTDKTHSGDDRNSDADPNGERSQESASGRLMAMARTMM